MLASVKAFFKPPKEVVTSEPSEIKTPDIWKIEQCVRQLIFVTDDLKSGHPNHKLIDDANIGPDLPDCYTHHPFTLWKKDLGSHSFAVPLPADYVPKGYVRWPVEALPIKGELYAIRSTHMNLLDNHKQNGVQFRRERVELKYPYRGVTFSKSRPLPTITPDCFLVISAWMYVGIPEYWDPQIGGIFNSQIHPTDHHLPRVWSPRYYRFEAG